MKILLPLYEIQDLGGIINWVEHLCHGFRALGHEPTLVRIENKRSVRTRGTEKATQVGWSGVPYNQRGGWAFTNSNKVPLMSTDWVKYTDNYDLIIWPVPVPSRQKLWDGWEDLYQTRTPQIMVIHDGNLNKLYPHAYDVMPYCQAVVGVHDCAYNSIGHKAYDPDILKIRTPKVLIPNPQILEGRMTKPDYSRRMDQVFSLQTFKRWKRVDDLVRAVPHIDGEVCLAGGGIEYYYMTSTDKTKKEYKGIWSKALKSGMRYLGYLPEKKRDEILQASKLLIDPSWSKSYAKYGSHFNRTFVDAIIAGCMPAGRDLLMDNNSFFNKEDYVTIPYNATPEEFGANVNYALSLTKKQYNERIERMQRVVLEKFDSVEVAAKYLEFS